MKTRMVARANEEETRAYFSISTVFKGIDKMKEFGEIKSRFEDATTIGMKWNNSTGEYEAEIELTPENAKPFVEYAESHNLELIMA